VSSQGTGRVGPEPGIELDVLAPTAELAVRGGNGERLSAPGEIRTPILRFRRQCGAPQELALIPLPFSTRAVSVWLAGVGPVAGVNEIVRWTLRLNERDLENAARTARDGASTRVRAPGPVAGALARP
jgi:hypothetical protein